MPPVAEAADTASAADFVDGETPNEAKDNADQSIEQWAKDITKSVFADEKPAKPTPEPEKPKAATPDPVVEKPNPADVLKPGTKDYNWNQLKSEKEKLASEVAELKAKLASPESQAQLEALQKERDELSKLLEQYDIERHPRFQQHYDGSLKRIAETAKQVVAGENGEKMSKSRGNVVNPDTYIEKFGADTMRLYLMFMGPMDGSPDFRDTGIEGMERFIGRINSLYERGDIKDQSSKEVLSKLHKTIKKVTSDISEFRYNTAITL